MDIFALVLSFALVFLGIRSRNYWLSLFTALVATAFYPELETVLWLLAAFGAGWIWDFSSKRLSTNSYFLFVVMLVGTIASIVFGVLALAFFFVAALVLVLLLGTVVRTGKKVAHKAKDEWADLKKGVESAKGQSPDGLKEIENVLNAAGTRAGELLNPNMRNKYAMPKPGERLGQAAKNLIDGFFRLFK